MAQDKKVSSEVQKLKFRNPGPKMQDNLNPDETVSWRGLKKILQRTEKFNYSDTPTAATVTRPFAVLPCAGLMDFRQSCCLFPLQWVGVPRFYFYFNFALGEF